MNPQEFVQAFAEAFGSDTQLPIAFGYSDEPLTEPKEGLRCLMGLFPKMLSTMKNTCLFDTPAWSKIKQRIEK